MSTRRLLLTGSSGSVARLLRPGLRDYRVRLFDREATSSVGAWSVGDGEHQVVGELTDPGALGDALADIDTVVHLAGVPDPAADWTDLQTANVEGFRLLLEHSRRAGVRRVVYASSVHAVGQDEADGRTPANPLWPPAPCCAYGATKAFDEALARVYSRRAGLSTIGLRLGATVAEPTQTQHLAGWLGPSDLQQLVRRAVESDVHFGVYFGVSANTRGRFDTGNARADLGYIPILDSERYAGALGRGDERVTCPD